MAYSGYQLGTTVGDVAPLSTLGVKDPKGSTFVYPMRLDLGDGGQRNVGFPQVDWSWGFLTQDQYDALRDFCSEASAAVVIMTRLNDGTFAAFEAKMIWPTTEERSSDGRRLDLTIRFRQLVTTTIPEPP